MTDKEYRESLDGPMEILAVELGNECGQSLSDAEIVQQAVLLIRALRKQSALAARLDRIDATIAELVNASDGGKK